MLLEKYLTVYDMFSSSLLKSGFANTRHVRKETLSRELRLEGMSFLSLLLLLSLIREVGRNITSSVVVITNTLTRSVFNALSIGSGLVAAVFLFMETGRSLLSLSVTCMQPSLLLTLTYSSQ